MTLNKIIYENYNPDTKETTITIKNKYGTFTGVAKLNDDELQYNSTFAGGRYAEAKAKGKYYMHRARLLADKRNNYIELYSHLLRSNEDPKSAAMRKIRKQIHVCEREIKYWVQRKNYEWNTLDNSEINRRKILDRNKEGNNEARDALLNLIKQKNEELGKNK